MCGISAIFRFTQITDTDKEKLSLMNQEMHYRGPDDNDIWTDNTCGLAHTRLSIIGLDNGKQPLFSEDRSLVLVCNGEIYNYIELRKLLEAKGHVFNSDTDSETILHLYEEYGVQCLNHLRGMFAFCIWNIHTKELFVARDRIGEKTLYYAQIQTGIVFSTELKAILKHYIENPQINEHALAETLRHNFPIDLKNTWIEQIKRLHAGEYALVDQHGIIFNRYWKRYIQTSFTGTSEDAKKHILQLMRESVDLCLRSDVPVAILLSGGIDSSAIAALAKEIKNEVHVITAGYKGNYDCDERNIAKRFALEKGLVYHEIELDVNDFKSLFQEFSRYIDEPVCDVSSMSQWALYKKARELGFKVLLGGIGGDEQFYGYPPENKLAKSMLLRQQHLDFFPWKGVYKKIRFLKFLMHNWRYVLMAGYPWKIDDKIPVQWTYSDYMKFVQTGYLNFRGKEIIFKEIDVHYSHPVKAGLKEEYDFLFSRFMTTLCLYLADRQGMGNSMEIRSPLLDYKLVEFSSSLPESMKFKEEEPKWLIKESLKGIVPNYILNAPKRGFAPPFDFIAEMNSKYQYKVMESDFVFFNSMLADTILNQLLGKN